MIQGYQAKLLRARRARSQSNLRARLPICGPRARGPALFSGLLMTMKRCTDDDDDEEQVNRQEGDDEEEE